MTDEADRCGMEEPVLGVHCELERGHEGPHEGEGTEWPSAPRRAAEATEYVVLERTGSTDGFEWRPLGDPVSASSAKQAVGKVAKKPGDYKAVPARSWRTFRVSETRPEPRRTVEEVD